MGQNKLRDLNFEVKMEPKYHPNEASETPWTPLERFGGHVGSFGELLGPSVELLGSSLGALGGDLWEVLGVILGAFGEYL